MFPLTEKANKLESRADVFFFILLNTENIVSHETLIANVKLLTYFYAHKEFYLSGCANLLQLLIIIILLSIY